MSQIYNDYTKTSLGWFLGLTGWQAMAVGGSTLPVFWALNQQSWSAAILFTLLSGLTAVLTIVPVRGRSAIGWLLALAGFTVGGLMHWTTYRSSAATGRAEDLTEVDLPGSLAGIEIHEGPPNGLDATRIAVIQNHATRTWAATASINHPGVGLRGAMDRSRMGRGLTELLDLAGRAELIDEILFLVRTVPEDGAERDQWISRHRRPDSPPGVQLINDELQAAFTRASVRTEAYVTIVVPESRIAKAAKESGGGAQGRAQVMYGLMGEVEAQLKGGMGVTQVRWLTSPELAAVCRTGFAPGDRVGIVDALLARSAGTDTNAEVPWAMAGPSGADAAARHYSHDAWNSISATIKLPVKGAVIGALAPVLTPTRPGERRSILVAYPILSQAKATRESSSTEWAADMGEALRTKLGVKQSTKARDEAAKTRAVEAKLARGNVVTRPYAVCTVTAPKTVRIAAAGRDLDAAIRLAGFAPLRLDLSQDVAFAASVVPLGVSLTRQTAN